MSASLLGDSCSTTIAPLLTAMRSHQFQLPWPVSASKFVDRAAYSDGAITSCTIAVCAQHNTNTHTQHNNTTALHTTPLCVCIHRNMPLPMCACNLSHPQTAHVFGAGHSGAGPPADDPEPVAVLHCREPDTKRQQLPGHFSQSTQSTITTECGPSEIVFKQTESGHCRQ